MDIGVTLRNMGVQSSAAIMATGAQAAEELDFESIWITDHIAIPPDDAEGSGGRYTDTLTTLAWLGGKTNSIKLGSGVLILPYRPILPTAKQVATIHELTDERLLLGVGIGWMDPEFRALGVDRHRRGVDSDAVLSFLNECFENDVVSLNGQEFLFRPRPKRPPIYVGGRAPHALARAIRFDAGWLPMVNSPAKLAADMKQFEEMAAESNKPMGAVTVVGGLDLKKPEAARQALDDYEALGVERVVCGIGYQTSADYRHELERLREICDL
ncbi:MAG: TIGR03619 family F420-dependent LLM class oxidoreductase [Pseudomonadales bacterium]|nr:TIGR03619 family F420-dependent LLM class oxidoreductase [Pseudomonadales bacterium]